MQEYVDGRPGAINTSPPESRGPTVIKIHHNYSDIIMEMAPYTLLNLFYVIVSHFPSLCSLSYSGSH